MLGTLEGADVAISTSIVNTDALNKIYLEPR
jgi:hypothetical protein